MNFWLATLGAIRNQHPYVITYISAKSGKILGLKFEKKISLDQMLGDGVQS